MLNVVIVDDEEWICKLIRNILDWNNLGFNIIAEAHDGMAALELIKKHKPQLVITDILMPEPNGISLIKQTRELEIKTEFIIISGYSEFEYARSALKYDVFGYLLKPLDNSELTEMLVNVREKIRNDNLIKMKTEYSNTLLLEKQIADMLSKTYDEEKEVTLKTYNDEYGLALKEGLFQVALLQFDLIEGKTWNAAIQADIRKFAVTVKESLKSICYETIVYLKEKMNTVVCIMNYGIPAEKQVLNDVKSLLDIYKQNGLYKNLYLTIGIGICIDNIAELNDAYFSALNAIKARIKLGKDKLIRFLDPEIALKQIVSIEDEKKLQFSIDIFDKKGFDSLLNDLFNKYMASAADNTFIALKLAYEIVNLIISEVRKKDIYSGKEFTDSYEMFQTLDACSTESELIHCINKIFDNYIKKYENYRGVNSGNRLINTIKNYIAENYKKDISLNDVAKLVCLNPNYLSALFKKETGENFSDYITSYRISIAKGYLKDVKYKVVDVSALVGYKDSRYFSKLFKKNVGVCPTDYQNMYL